MTQEEKTYSVEITGDGFFTMEIPKDELICPYGRPMMMGGLVALTLWNDDDYPIRMWQKITYLVVNKDFAKITITDLNIKKGKYECLIEQTCDVTQFEEKQQRDNRYDVATKMMMGFLQLDDLLGKRQFMIDPKHIMRVLIGDEEFSMDNVRVVCQKTGKLLGLGE